MRSRLLGESLRIVDQPVFACPVPTGLDWHLRRRCLVLFVDRPAIAVGKILYRGLFQKKAVASVKKQRDMPGEETFHFKLQGILLGHDEDDDQHLGPEDDPRHLHTAPKLSSRPCRSPSVPP